jgi:uncharacterized protein (DUF736 family)
MLLYSIFSIRWGQEFPSVRLHAQSMKCVQKCFTPSLGNRWGLECLETGQEFPSVRLQAPSMKCIQKCFTPSLGNRWGLECLETGQEFPSVLLQAPSMKCVQKCFTPSLRNKSSVTDKNITVCSVYLSVLFSNKNKSSISVE